MNKENKTSESLQTNWEPDSDEEQLIDAQAKAERKLGAKILAEVGFQDRQQEVVEASLTKERERGEKFEGKNQVRRNEAYLERLERMIEKDGNALEKKLWEKSIDKLVIEPEDIEENYWKSQEQILRDNGQGRELNDYEKEVLTEDLQKRQRESLESWSNYLGDENAPYPMWFKVYAWDGMSRMGVFDKDKGEFKKRNKHTVSPYPKLNPAVLAKVHGAISDFYDHDDKGRFAENEERDEELEGLVRSGNFNRLYSKFLLEQKSIPPTPERTEDVHGAWVEYLPGQEEALANAAEGTPWCIADPGTGRSYLEYGHNGDDDYDYYDEEDDEENGGNKAKFILFHLEDPETGNLVENACASIRLDTDGNVAEISGLNDGQALEDSLVPIVEEKVKTLPGGERFLEAFADKQKLIWLDRKMQAGEKLMEDEVKFVFETERPIAVLDTYNDEDPRIGELRKYAKRQLETQMFQNLQEGLPIEYEPMRDYLLGYGIHLVPSEAHRLDGTPFEYLQRPPFGDEHYGKMLRYALGSTVTQEEADSAGEGRAFRRELHDISLIYRVLTAMKNTDFENSSEDPKMFDLWCDMYEDLNTTDWFRYLDQATIKQIEEFYQKLCNEYE